MGDNGRFYTGFDCSYLETMKDVAASAQLLLPNLTEAAFLTGRNYLGEQYEREDIIALLQDLGSRVAGDIVLTGVSLEENQIGVAYFQQESGEVAFYMAKKWPAHFFGTGDILSTLVATTFVEKIDLHRALPVFLDFINKSLEQTLLLERDLKFGIYFEPFLAELGQSFQALKRRL